MTRRYLNADASTLLDAWVEASGVVPAMTLEGVSFWYGARLGHWLWLVDQLLWINVLDDLLGANPGVREITCDAGTDAPLVAAARLVGERDGLTIGGEASAPAPVIETPAVTDDRCPRHRRAPRPAARRRSSAGSAGGSGRPSRSDDGGSSRNASTRSPPSRPDACSSCRRTRSSASTPRPDLGSSTRTSARCSTACGAAASTRSRSTCARPWRIPTPRGRSSSPRDRSRSLPLDVIGTLGVKTTGTVKPRDEARARADRILAGAAPLEVSGVDLGPGLARIVADRRGGHARSPDRRRRPDPRAPAPDARRRGSCSPTSTTARTGWPPPPRRACRSLPSSTASSPRCTRATSTAPGRRSSGSPAGPTCSGPGSGTC